jgi:hypothetical protein
MPPKLQWTAALDAQLCRLRAEGATWDTIASLLSVSRYTAIERGRRIGARKPPPEHRVRPSKILEVILSHPVIRGPGWRSQTARFCKTQATHFRSSSASN